jgi:hypothetical protein
LRPDSGIDKSWRRNAALAWLTFNFDERESPFSLSTDPSPSCYHPFRQFALILEYLEQYGDASTAFNDVRPFAERLVPDERRQLLNKLLLNGSKQKQAETPVTVSLSPLNQDVSSNVLELLIATLCLSSY